MKSFALTYPEHSACTFMFPFPSIVLVAGLLGGGRIECPPFCGNPPVKGTNSLQILSRAQSLHGHLQSNQSKQGSESNYKIPVLAYEPAFKFLA